MTIQIACDGSCIQHGDFRKGDDTDRPGAAGFVAAIDGMRVGKAEPHANGTIGAMEVRALLMGLRFASDLAERRPELASRPVEIICDSQYVVNGFQDWLPSWAAKGYHKKGGLANAADWREIDGYKAKLGTRVKVVWTRGHSSGSDPRSVMNRAADEVVNTAARTQKEFDDTHHALGGKAPDGALREAAAETAPEAPQRRTGGIVAQAAELLAKAADDPQLSAILATGLEMALSERRITARYGKSTIQDAQAIRSMLDARSAGR